MSPLLYQIIQDLFRPMDCPKKISRLSSCRSTACFIRWTAGRIVGHAVRGQQAPCNRLLNGNNNDDEGNKAFVMTNFTRPLYALSLYCENRQPARENFRQKATFCRMRSLEAHHGCRCRCHRCRRTSSVSSHEHYCIQQMCALFVPTYKNWGHSNR